MTFVEPIFLRLKGKKLKSPERQATLYPSNDQPPREGGFWKKFDWWLVCALAIPVILETLDYTGKSFLFFLHPVSPYWDIQSSPLRNLELQ
ncbi:hypothetical protein BDR03DRAFT_693287 [Suillus americanus]|nr:hypothetical protein BDR03DRAFT_693287 [Suillus americanus]